MLKTPEKIRELQRKLYLKAKQEKNFRFYLLYDKVYRWDILNHAYNLERQNGGKSGVDGITFEQIEAEGKEKFLRQIQEELKEKTYHPQPVKRVYIPKPDGRRRPLGIPTIKDRVVQMACKLTIEPIFEADFKENSYAYRPKKDAHQAVDDVTRHLAWGKTKVIDCDLSKYFDSIPHEHLLKLVARRIVDKNILKLIKMWLKAPVVEEREDGKKETKGGKKNNRGTPQGAVISPLLANIYLNVVDTLWKAKKIEQRFKARLIHYADDIIVLCGKETKRAMKVVKEALKELDLTLNETKTRIVNAEEESFDFLGFTIRMVHSRKTGKPFPLTRPSKEAMKRIRREIKEKTSRKRSFLSVETVIYELNQMIEGWVNYFYFKNCSRDLSQFKEYLNQRVRIFLRRKHRKKGQGYKAYPNSYLYEVLGLFKIPTNAPWTSQVKASG